MLLFQILDFCTRHEIRGDGDHQHLHKERPRVVINIQGILLMKNHQEIKTFTDFFESLKNNLKLPERNDSGSFKRIMKESGYVFLPLKRGVRQPYPSLSDLNSLT